MLSKAEEVMGGEEDVGAFVVGEEDVGGIVEEEGEDTAAVEAFEVDEEEGGGATIPIRQGWCQNLVSRKKNANETCCAGTNKSREEAAAPTGLVLVLFSCSDFLHIN
eukprot:scaffold959_cov103-Alexandrium_tamarense.AAC.1